MPVKTTTPLTLVGLPPLAQLLGTRNLTARSSEQFFQTWPSASRRLSLCTRWHIQLPDIPVPTLMARWSNRTPHTHRKTYLSIACLHRSRMPCSKLVFSLSFSAPSVLRIEEFKNKSNNPRSKLGFHR